VSSAACSAFSRLAFKTVPGCIQIPRILLSPGYIHLYQPSPQACTRRCFSLLWHRTSTVLLSKLSLEVHHHLPESGGWLPASTSYSNSPYKTNLVPLLRRLAPVRRGGLYCEVPEFNMGFDSEECSGLQYRACQLSIRQLARRGNPLFRCLVSSPWHLVGDFLGSRSGEHARWYFIISFV
jgi:hypothetical protein